MSFAARAVHGAGPKGSSDQARLPVDAAPRPGGWSLVVRLVAVLPVGFVLLLASMAALAQAAGPVGLRPLASSWGSGLLFLAALFPTVWVCRTAAPRLFVHPLGLLPSGVIAAYGVAAWALPQGRRVEWFLGGDHVRHLVFVAEEAAAGRLSYGDQTYPRAWHTLVAALWRIGGGREDAAGLAALVDLMSSLTWLLPALLAVATATGTAALARAVGLDDRAAAWASLAATAVLLVPTFLGNYQAMGFENSYVVAIVTAVVARDLLDGAGGLSPVLVAASAAVVCAHAWQLLLPGAGLALLVATVGRLRCRGGRIPVAAVWAVALVAAWPALAALVSEIGLDHATDSDVEAPYSVVLMVAAVVAALGLAAVARDVRLWAFAALVLLPGLTAVGLVLALGVGLGDYYPSKLFWHTSVLGVQATAVAVALLGRRFAPTVGRRSRRVAAVVLGASGVLLGGYAALSPLGAFAGAWSTVRGPVVVEAITTPGAGRAQVVWLGSVGDDTIARILLDFYRAGASPERTPQPPLTVEEECALLRSSEAPTVLSNGSPVEVRQRYACVPRVSVVRVTTSP